MVKLDSVSVGNQLKSPKTMMNDKEAEKDVSEAQRI